MARSGSASEEPSARPADAGPGADFDLFIIGGGVNGCGIARDAAGRGLRVGLAEMNDLASATSSASTKLFHGGLRYLEFFEFRLVREALKEREVLLSMMPHISWPMRFVLPYHPGQRFEADTPTSRLLAFFLPWMRGRRPAWLIRLGLFIYDHLGGRRILPGTETIDLANSPLGEPLKETYRRAYEYSDCWVQDARLVVLNARDAAARGATVLTRTRVTRAERGPDKWTLTLDGAEGAREVTARCVVNAAGPWVSEVLGATLGLTSPAHVRLVRGSHIVTRKLYDHDRAYFFQGRDGRIIFSIPYEDGFTLIGTTEADHAHIDKPPACTDAEADYLCAFASEYFRRPVTRADVVWTYSGVRPLYDDGSSSATAATRDYVLELDRNGAPALSVFGGKITTYRRLAEHAMERLGAVFGDLPGAWTAGTHLPGGDFPVSGFDALVEDLQRDYPFVAAEDARRLARTYGTEARAILGGAQKAPDLGEAFGAGVTEAELRWVVENEFVTTGEDFLWRRTKLGLHLDSDRQRAVSRAIDRLVAARPGGAAS